MRPFRCSVLFPVSRFCVCAFAVFAWLIAAGCSPQNPYEVPIKAVIPEDLSSWLAFNTSQLEGSDVSELNTCLREFKTSLRMEDTANVEQRLCTELNGKPLKWVLTEGCRLRVERLKAERRAYTDDLKYKETLHARPDDMASEDYLTQQRDLTRKQIAKITDDIDVAEAHYHAFLKKFNMPVPEESVEESSSAQKHIPSNKPVDAVEQSGLDEVPKRIQ